MLAGVPILKRTVHAFLQGYSFDEVVVALPADIAANPPSYLDDVIIVEGGSAGRIRSPTRFVRSPRALR